MKRNRHLIDDIISNESNDTQDQVVIHILNVLKTLLLSNLDDECLYRNIVENEQHLKDLIIFMQMAINSFWTDKSTTNDNYPQLLEEEDLFIIEALKMYIKERIQKNEVAEGLKTNNNNVVVDVLTVPSQNLIPTLNQLDLFQQLCNENDNDWYEIDFQTDWNALLECQYDIHLT